MNSVRFRLRMARSAYSGREYSTTLHYKISHVVLIFQVNHATCPHPLDLPLGVVSTVALTTVPTAIQDVNKHISLDAYDAYTYLLVQIL